jgi:uncharacterized protein YkwD
MFRSRVLYRCVFVTLLIGACWCGRPGMAQSIENNLTQLEQGVLEKINQYRQIFRLPPLQPDATLSQAAREHSADMMRQGRVTHESAIPGQRTPEERYEQAFGTPPQKLTENVGMLPPGLSTPDFLFTNLTYQSGTLQNLVDKETTSIGVGLAVGQDGRVWATVMCAGVGGRPAPAPALPLPAPENPAPPPASPSSPPARSDGKIVYRGILDPEFFAFMDAAGGFSDMYRLTENLPGGEAAVQAFWAFAKTAYDRERETPTSGRAESSEVTGTQLKEFQFLVSEHYPEPKAEAYRSSLGDIPRHVPGPVLTSGQAKGSLGGWFFNPHQYLVFNVPGPGDPAAGATLTFHVELACAPVSAAPDGRITGTCSMKYKYYCWLGIPGSGVPIPGGWRESETRLAWYAVPSDPSATEYRLYLDRAPETKLLSEQLTADMMGHFPVLVAVLRPEGAPPVTESRTPPPVKETAQPPIPASVDTAAQDDEDSAADIRWLTSIEEQLNDAEKLKNKALYDLEQKARCIAELQRRIDALNNLLKDLPLEEEAATNLEAAMRAAIDIWDSAWGPPPGPGKDVRVFVNEQIEVLKQKILVARKEQDDKIQEVLETYYGGIMEQLRERGPQCKMPEARAAAQQAIKDLNQIITYSKVELYGAADRGKEFQEAARACIAEGRYVPETHFLQAVWAASHGNRRLALEAFRHVEQETAAPEETPMTGAKARELEAQGSSLHNQARAMVWILEDTYLKEIAAKAAGEAQQVRAEEEQRLQKAGDDSGLISNALTYLKMGEVSALSAITGREDALEGLASAYQNSVAAQEYGLLLMRSLHERGVSLGSLRGMTNDEFLDLIHSQYQEAGQKVTPADALQMRAAILAALNYTDAGRLAASQPATGSKQMLKVDTGADYFYHGSYAETELEWWGDAMNLANVLMFMVPVTDFSIVGKMLGRAGRVVLGDARAAGVAIDSATETAAVTGMASQLPRMFAETKTGQMMLNEFSRFFAKSTWLKDRALEMSVQLIGGMTGAAVGGTIGVLMGSDGKAEAEAGELLASLFAGWAAGDAGKMKALMQAHGITSEQVQAVAAAQERAAKASAELADAAGRHAGAIREALPTSPGEAISAEAKLKAGKTRQQIEAELDRAIGDIQAANQALRNGDKAIIDAAAFRKAEEMVVALEGAASAERGEIARARAILDCLDRKARLAAAGTKLTGAAAETAEVAAALPQAGARPGAAAESIEAASHSAGVPSFRGNGITRNLDLLVMEPGKLTEALAGYKNRLALLRQIAADELIKAGHLYENIASLEKTAELKSIVSGWPKGGSALAHENPVTEEELASLMARSKDGRIRLRPIAGSEFKNEYEEELLAKLSSQKPPGPKKATAQKPYWVEENRGDDKWERVGVFKEGHPAFRGRDIQAETLFEDVKRTIGPVITDAKREVRLGIAACGKVQMYFGKEEINGILVDIWKDGTFVRFADGCEVGALGTAAAPLVKEQIAGDMVISTLFGDPDRHEANFLIAGLGDVADFDHGFADIDGFFFEQDFRTPKVPDPLNDRESIKTCMKRDILTCRNRNPVVKALHELITIEDMKPWIEKFKPFFKDKESLSKFLNDNTRIKLGSPRFNEIVDIGLKRFEVLEETLHECFGSKKNLKPLPMEYEETKMPRGPSASAKNVRPIPIVRVVPWRGVAPQAAARATVESLALAA